MKIANVREKIRNRMEINDYGTQFVTGNENFRSYLNRVGLGEKPHVNDGAKQIPYALGIQ